MCYGVLHTVSSAYPPVKGMLLTRYSPFRRSPASIARPAAPRLACVKPAASVHPEPGSNSSLYNFLSLSMNLTLPLRNRRSFKVKKLLHFLGTCLYFPSSLFNELLYDFLPTALRPGCKKSRSFSKRDCKGTHYFRFRNTFLRKFLKKFAYKSITKRNPLIMRLLCGASKLR